MKDKNNLEPSDYINYVSGCFIPNKYTVNYNSVSNIVITDGVKDLHICYKGKIYVFDVEKTLKLLCKELDK